MTTFRRNADFKQHIASIRRTGELDNILTREQEADLAKRMAAGDERAFERLVYKNQRLVYSIALKYFKQYFSEQERHLYPMEDVVQRGNIGLIKAIQNFDYTLGYTLSNYARHWIKAYIRHMFLRDEERMIRKKSFSPDQFAYDYDDSTEDTLERIATEHDQTLLGDSEDDELQTQIEALMEVEALLDSVGAEDVLDDEHMYILLARHGINQQRGIPLTYQQIADEIGRGWSYTRNHYDKAVEALRHHAAKQQFIQDVYEEFPNLI